ncbi:MAG: hypothetical protein ACI4K6_09755 [Candidatus Fimenecus sp.]
MDKEVKKAEQGKCTETESAVENAEKPTAETTTEKGEETPAQPTEPATEQETDEAENGEQAKADGVQSKTAFRKTRNAVFFCLL